MFTYSLEAYHAAEALDKYNFEKEITCCRNLKKLDAFDVREHISALHNQEVEESLDILSLDEFMEYMTDRYGIRWQEIVIYKMV